MKLIAFLLACSLIISCGHSRNAPDVSTIPVTVTIERFDHAFFEIDSNDVLRGLHELNTRYPYFTFDFVANILGAGPLSDTNKTAILATRTFLSSYLPVRDSIAPLFKDLGWLEKELQDGFKHVKYYFPNYQLPPKVVAFIGPFDAPGIAMTQFTLAIGLQLYAGKNLSFYRSVRGQELFPEYISRRFEPAFIAPNSMKAIAEDIFPDNSGSRPLIEQMIEKGKYWWLVNRFMPDVADTLITGFTQKQTDWAKENEGLIWNYFLQSDLFTIDPDLIKNYIGDAPHTQGMPDSSPGNIGQWVGWQIVKKYASENPDLTPAMLMKMDPKKIFNETKYKPK
ncbi:MAG: hypothetical protein C5B59_03070 [Bacteroidetes bacterium]|nr:MAG: hypothetical protein C5B59_03070 [Bacteroidota bacterium]